MHKYCSKKPNKKNNLDIQKKHCNTVFIIFIDKRVTFHLIIVDLIHILSNYF